MDLVAWLDPGIPGVEIKIAEYVGRTAPDSVEKAVLIHFRSRLPEGAVQALLAAGFQSSGRDAMTMARKGGSFTYGELRAAFPAIRQIKIEPAKVRERYDMRPTAAPASAASGPVLARRVAPGARPVAATVQGASPAPPAVPTAGVTSTVPLRRPVGRPVAPATANASPAAVPTASQPPSPMPSRPGVRRPAARVVDRAQVFSADSDQVAWSGDRINRFQVRYKPASKVGVPIATIPINLSVATEAALQRVADEYGDIDEFVATRLGWSVSEMEKYLSPEQVDAVALALAAADRGQGFVLADQTGLGKGRVVAAIARAIIISGRPAIVITEKENLFSDLFRDIGDIGSLDLVGRPLMLNDGAQIVDGSSGEPTVVHAAWKKPQVSEAIKSGQVPDGVKLVLATYSQFNRRGSAKSEYLKAIAHGSHLVCDESHNAVGDSATSEVLSEAMDVAAAVTYSSATFAKNAKNLAAYERLFPASMRSSDLMSVLSSGGQAISEALSQMLAEDGAYLRREHDLSDIKIEVLDDAARLGRNRAYADALSPILARIAKVSRSVSELADDRNGGRNNGEGAVGRKASKEQWYTGNFGARLGVIVRQFVTALLVDLCVEKSVKALEDGEKPVIVIESTMESLMRELAADDGVEARADGETDGEAVIETLIEDETEIVSTGKPPDFGDALRLMVDRTMMLMVRRPGQEDPDRVPVDEPDLVAEADAIRAEIARFPELPLSPIDDVRSLIEQAGQRLAGEGRIERPWVAKEISARGMRVVDGQYQKLPPQDRVAEVAAFNAGMSDALVITRAASTGLSLHSSEKVKDQRRRRMIELQIPSNVVERVQFWGRVNRRGQMNIPGFDTLSTGLPLQTRQLAIQNRKVADLSANVTASAESASAMDVPDMIDAVGNAVCRRILEEKPSIADRMHIPLKLQDMEKAETELYHVNKFLQRLVLLPAREQEALYNEALAAYEDAVRDLAARGRNPRGARELEGEWRVVDREIFDAGDGKDGPVFGRPVTVTTIESERVLKPWSSAQVVEAVNVSNTALQAARGAEPNNPFAAHIKAIDQSRPNILQAALSQNFISTRQALADAKPNAVKDAETRLTRLRTLLGVIRPGFNLEITGEEGHEIGIVVDIRAPKDLKDAHLAGRWSIRYIVPGDERPREISAASINRDARAIISPPVNGQLGGGRLAFFDRAPSGATTVRRKILDGNLVKAVIAARHAGWGSSVTWTDRSGSPHRAILVPKNKQDILDQLPGRVTNAAVARELLRSGAELWTNPDDPDAGATLRMSGDTIHVTIPGNKRFAKLFEIEEIMAVTGRYRGDHRSKSAAVPAHRIEALCAVFAAGGHAFHFGGRYRAKVAEICEQLSPQPEDPEPAMAP